MKVLFLCHGNINRSAAGEIILRRMKPDWKVCSAGLKENAGGSITAKKMRDALNEKGFLTSGIRSQPTTQNLVEWADVIFYMDEGNRKRLEEKFGHVMHKSILLASLIGESKIPDPNFAPNNELHKRVIDMIVKALGVYIDGLSEKN